MVEPEPSAPRPRISWPRVVTAGAIAALVVVVIDAALDGDRVGQHLGPVRVLTTVLDDRFPRGVPVEGLIIVAAVVALGVIYAVILDEIVARMRESVAIPVGAAFGALVYAWHFYGLVPFVPWLAAGRGAQNALTHVLFGVVAASVVRLPWPVHVAAPSTATATATSKRRRA